MFGYVKPYTPLLRVKDSEFYKAVYCGLCGCTAKCNGCSSTVTLSYDIAFLALVRMALAGEKLEIVKKRCVTHPLKKRNRIAPCAELEFCSQIGVLLSYYKIIDNINDERGNKRIVAKLMKPFFSSARKKVLKHGGEEADRIISEGLSALRVLERERCNSVDETSDTFAEMLSRLASLGLSGSNRIIAENAGFAVGKWIYIADAVDDADGDMKSGAYNPIIALYGGESPSVEQMQDIFLALSTTKQRLCAALDLISYKDEEDEMPEDCTKAYFSDELRSVIENIAYVGLPKTEQRITKSREERLSASER